MSLIAGAAERDISPTRPMFLAGYPHVPRASTGVNDPLLASALYLSDGNTQVIAVSVDLLFISHEDVARWRARIQERTGVPANHILIAATHTHSGPITVEYLVFQGDPVVPRVVDLQYLEHVGNGVVDAAVEAHASAAPATLAFTTAHVEGVGCNRLDPSGPRDAEAPVFAIASPDGKTLRAILMVYAMHPTVMHEDSTKVSSDFPGYTRMHLRERFPGVITCYFNGMSGNQSPRYHVRGQTFAEAERLGRTLGQTIADAVAKLSPQAYRSELKLSAADAHVPLQRRQFKSLEEAQANLAQKRSEYERLKREGAPRPQVRTAECTVFGAEEVLTLAQAQASGAVRRFEERYRQAQVQVLRIGDVALAAFPGEFFVEYALELRRRLKDRCPVYAISLANGELQGYIVTPEAEAANGYEAQMSFFPASAGAAMLDAAARLIQA